jgi:hypothetical protein
MTTGINRYLLHKESSPNGAKRATFVAVNNSLFQISKNLLQNTVLDN